MNRPAVRGGFDQRTKNGMLVGADDIPVGTDGVFFRDLIQFLEISRSSMRRSMLFLLLGSTWSRGPFVLLLGREVMSSKYTPGLHREKRRQEQEDQRTTRGEDIQFMAEKLSIRSHRGRFVDNAHLLDDGSDVILASRMQ